MSMSSRIAEAINYALSNGKSGVDLAAEAGLIPSRITQLKAGKGGINAEKLFSFARATGFRPEYLAEGIEPKYESGNQSCIPIQVYEMPEKFVSVFTDQLKGLDHKTLRVIWANDDRMSTTINKDDMLLIDMAKKQPVTNQVYAITSEDGITLRRMIRHITGNWLIRSDNLDKLQYPDEKLNGDQIEQIQFIGRVVWASGRL